jgi:hypothetical protein
MRKYGDRGSFYVGQAEKVAWLMIGGFDVVLAIGVLHHLGDEEVDSMLNSTKSALNEGGRVVTIDPCFVEQQSTFARFLINRDRGRNVRTEQGYRLHFQSHFESVKSTVRHDLLNIPYTHCIFECSGKQIATLP